jgi:hypothetical protein
VRQQQPNVIKGPTYCKGDQTILILSISLSAKETEAKTLQVLSFPHAFLYHHTTFFKLI